MYERLEKLENMTKQEKIQMYEAIEKHGENLNNIFKTDLDNVTLCKKLNTLERQAHRLTLEECNRGGADNSEALEKILNKVKELLNAPDGWIFVNGDARGYALKIDDKVMKDNNLRIESDLGGYGIVAPDFTPER